MARAKRTNDRADARRRYRSTQLAEGGELEADGAQDGAPGTPGGAPAKPTATRPSFTAAFRNAYHKANVREDLPYLPSLIRHWSFWVPLLLMIGSGVATAAAANHPVTQFMFQTFIYPPALIVLFICGFFAKRATYVLGVILALVNVIVFTAVVPYWVRTFEQEPSNEQIQAFILNALIFSPPAGVLFCSLAAWYRRFLALTNPSRGRRPKAKPKPVR